MGPATTDCADCDTKNPQWASINRGVFICDECNSIHRQLGRHVSHTKHLYKSLWRPSQLFMVQYLALAGANRFWEHVLLEPLLAKRSDPSKISSVVDKKPQPDSPLHPTKADFIRKKYLFHGFFKIPNVIHPDDLNQQLHASVRTAVLETSLYLLALGADPNYIHPVKGTSPVHVACQYEQVGQLELLIAYGGDVCLRSSKGITPLEIALEKVQKSQQQLEDTGTETSLQFQAPPWSPLIECLISAFYELTDSLSFYLCRRVPNHKAAIFLDAASVNGGGINGFKNGQSGAFEAGGPFRAFYGPGHFLVAPKSVKESNGSLNGEADRQAEARAKVRALDNTAFEDLCIDVYDEAERRLTNSFLESSIDSSIAMAQISALAPSVRPSALSSIGGRPHSMSGSLLPSIPSSATSSIRPSSLILFFLPPNTSYTSVRNQARQKLGRLSMTAFRALVVDVLHEAARRLVPVLESTPSLPFALVRPKVKHEYTTFGGGDISEILPSQMAVDNDDEVLLVVGSAPGGAHSILRRNRTAYTTTISAVEDPVYDQVAVETEFGTVARVSVSTGHSISTNAISSSGGTASISNSTSPTTAAIAAIDCTTSDSLRTDQLQQTQLESQADEEEEEDPTSQQHIFVSMGEESLTSEASRVPSGVDSRPGVIPGSRRLHLAATGHLASYRASVPALAYSNTFTDISKTNNAVRICPSSAVASAGASSSSTCEGTLERCTAPTMLQQSQEVHCYNTRLLLVSAAVQTSTEVSEVEFKRTEELERAAEVEAEVLQLREDKEKAEQQVTALTARLHELESVCERLTEENNALKAAFSAGMTKTHEAATRSTSTTVYKPPDTQNKTSSTAIATEEEAVETRDIALEASEDFNDSEEGEGYTNGDPLGQSKSKSPASGSKRTNGSSSNYAMGNQCLDSGILLRQGISLWGRSSSPADSANVEVVTTITTTISGSANASQTQSSLPVQASSGATRSYVNLQTTKPSAARTPIGKQQQTSQVAGSPAISGLHEVEVPDDYTAPNETGTPNPAPPVISAPTSRSSSSGAGISAHRSPPFGVMRSCAGGPEPSSVEYSIPPHPSPSGVLRKNPPVSVSSGVISPPWKHPPYERIVRGVECIIVRIRALLDAANGRRLHEQVRSAQLIQAAVQDLVVLFPPISKCHPKVGAALSSLMANSQKLRLHCEANMDPNTPSASSRVPGGSSSSQLITFAHEIASAAKTILNFFQNERH